MGTEQLGESVAGTPPELQGECSRCVAAQSLAAAHVQPVGGGRPHTGPPATRGTCRWPALAASLCLGPSPPGLHAATQGLPAWDTPAARGRRSLPRHPSPHACTPHSCTPRRHSPGQRALAVKCFWAGGQEGKRAAACELVSLCGATALAHCCLRALCMHPSACGGAAWQHGNPGWHNPKASHTTFLPCSGRAVQCMRTRHWPLLATCWRRGPAWPCSPQRTRPVRPAHGWALATLSPQGDNSSPAAGSQALSQAPSCSEQSKAGGERGLSAGYEVRLEKCAGRGKH